MAERRYPRPRSPPLQNPGRSSLPSFGYPYTEVYTVPVRKDSTGTPRLVSERAPVPGPITTTYTIKPESQPIRTDRESNRNRRSTLDGALRPTIVTAQPRSPARPQSPIHDPYRSSGEGGEYMTIPASSGKRHARHRQSYSATMDNADVHSLSREAGSRGMLGAGPGREGARYPTRRRNVYPGALVRHPDTVADDYGDNGYGYTNPRDLVQYDLNRPARYPHHQRRDSHEGPRPARPSSISGYADLAPRSYENRERGPPPVTRGLDKLATRSPLYDVPPARFPPTESGLRSPRKEQSYLDERPRQPAYRRPVSIYQDRPRREDHYDPRDDELRETRERQKDSKRYDERGDYHERPLRDESSSYEPKRREHRLRADYDSGNESDDYDDRAERKSTRDKHVSREKDYEKRNDYERKDEHDDHKERKRDKLAAGISVAAAALGLGAATTGARHEDSSDEKDDSDEHKRRREHRRRREQHEDAPPVDLTGRDPKERNAAREDRDRDVIVDNGGETKARNHQTEDKPVDLAGRNPQEKPAMKENRDDAEDSKSRRRSKSDVIADDSRPSSQENSTPSEEPTSRRRVHKEHGPGPDARFKATDTMDLRTLRDALNKKDNPTPPTPLAEGMREGSFERKREPSIQFEPPAREGRGRHESDEEEPRRPTPRLVSPPREVKKGEENKPRGILRPPREKFPEDPVPIREGVAPLKDAKKDGVPPDARWTKISRRMVNPEALDAGKERYEAREDFVIVLRVLTKEEIQGYAIATQKIRAAREQMDDMEERNDRRHRRRERHERHKHERERGERAGHPREREDSYEYDHDHRRHKKERDMGSESDTTPDDETGPKDKPAAKPIDNQKPRRIAFDEPDQTSSKAGLDSNLKENLERPGTYTGYVRNPPRK